MHASNDLRSEFQYAVEEFKYPPKAVCKALTDCSDIMPGDLCDVLDLPSGSTFGDGVAALRANPALLG